MSNFGAKIDIPTKSEIIKQMQEAGASAEEAEQAADLVIAKVGKVNNVLVVVEGVYRPLAEALVADSMVLPEYERGAFLLDNLLTMGEELAQAGLPVHMVLMLWSYMIEATRLVESDRLAKEHPENVINIEGQEAYKMQRPEGYEPKYNAAVQAAGDNGAFEKLEKVISGR